MPNRRSAVLGTVKYELVLPAKLIEPPVLLLVGQPFDERQLCLPIDDFIDIGILFVGHIKKTEYGFLVLKIRPGRMLLQINHGTLGNAGQYNLHVSMLEGVHQYKLCVRPV